MVKGLAAAAPQIKGLSEAVVSVVKSFSETGGLKDAINDLSDVLKGLTGFVKNPVGAIKDAVVNDAKREFRLFQKDFAKFPLPWSVGSGSSSATTPGTSVPGAAHRAPTPGTCPVKPGAGWINPALMDVARDMQGAITKFERITSGDDDYHKGTNSAHARGQAFDFTLKPGATSDDYVMAAQIARDRLRAQGIKGTVIDEMNHPSSRATAPHIHVQADVTVNTPAGSNLFVSGKQVSVTQ